jgi:hypothetical protein
MRWDDVIRVAVAALDADQAIVSELGGSGRIWPVDQTRAVQYDCIEYSIVSDVEEEVMNRIVVSFDIRCRGDDKVSAMKKTATVERRVRRVLTRPYNDGRIEGVYVNPRLVDARTMPVPEENVMHRQVDILFEPVRERYAAPNLA